MTPTLFGAGSSPHPWGTPQLVHVLGNERRFIPTPVGNTPGARSGCRRFSVHPHTRGEHSHSKEKYKLYDGSSPHPWGTLQDPRVRCYHPRFIPTPVGNTCRQSGQQSALPVHPHTRGEHVDGQLAENVPVGSSPHPWGTLRLGDAAVVRPRFIPTPVGNTRWSSPGRGQRAVHPHTRGEHCAIGAEGRAAAGSSPHPWGTPLPYPIVLKKEKQQQNSTGPSGPRAAPGNEGRTHPTA